MDLGTSRSLGAVGSILLVIGGLGFFGSGWAGLLSLVGLILVLIGIKGLSDYYKEGGIFNNALYGVITNIIGIVAFAAVFVVMVLFAVATWAIDWTNPSDWSSLAQGFMDFSVLWRVIGGVIAALVVLFIFTIVAAIFYRKSFNLLADRSGVGMFGTVGLLILIGAVLTIIVVGVIIIWIAFILLAVAFFSIKETSAQPSAATQ